MLHKLIPDYSFNPNDNAIRYKSTIITYNLLNNILGYCNELIPYNLCSSKIIFLMNKGVELVIATISAFVSKHTFCVLDVNTPDSVMFNILKELNTNMVFTDTANYSRLNRIAKLKQLNIIIFTFEHTKLELTLNKQINYIPLKDIITNHDCSHIVYTSGSTNKPKGIICSRNSMLDFIKWEFEYLKISSKVNVAQLSAPWFDPYLRDIFLPLYSGGCICIPTKREELDPKSFFFFAYNKQIDVVHIVPTLFRHLFLNDLYKEQHKITHILLAGEMLYGTDVNKYYEFYTSGELYNLYGPAETTMAKFCYKISRRDQDSLRIKVGMPLPETRYSLINENGQEVQKSEKGEVVIYTKQGSYGYLNKIETSACFEFLEDGVIAFKTGDIGMVCDDGNLELVGRQDFMKKIYGQKVYPEEIESILNKHKGIDKCVVLIEENKIVAVAEVNKHFSIKEVVSITNEFLPPYKRPRCFYEVAQICLNKSGKIDRKKIQSLQEIQYVKKYMI